MTDDPKPDDLATDILPDCMLPDGAEPCAGFRQEHERVERLTKELAAAERARDEAVAENNRWRQSFEEHVYVEDKEFSALAAKARMCDEAVADRDRLREALLNKVREDNDCCLLPLRPQCDGWFAEKCGCAVEARAALPLPVAPVSEG